MATVRLRSVLDEDEDFLFRVYASTREEELAITPWSAAEKDQFLRMQFDAQSKYYRQIYPEMERSIILHRGVAAGRFLVASLDDEFRLVDIALLPEHRGAGIGTYLIQKLFDRAKRKSKCVRMHVEHMNRARFLYERLGFRPIDDRGVYMLLEWNPVLKLQTADHEL